MNIKPIHKIRIVSLILIVIGSIFIAPWVLLPMVAAYALYWRAYELLLVAACIDAYFGGAVNIPYYTISVLFILIIMEWVRPSLLFNNH